MKGEYYADYDENSGLYCVFHTDNVNGKPEGFAFSSWSSMGEAQKAANKLNDPAN